MALPTTIDLCCRYFCVGEFAEEKGVKRHTLYDVEAQVPSSFHITTHRFTDSKVMNRKFRLNQALTIIFDRAYNNLETTVSHTFRPEDISW